MRNHTAEIRRLWRVLSNCHMRQVWTRLTLGGAGGERVHKAHTASGIVPSPEGYRLCDQVQWVACSLLGAAGQGGGAQAV